MKLNLESPANQIALFFLLLGINIIIFSSLAGVTAVLFFGSGNLDSAESFRYISGITQIGIFGLTAFEFAFLINNKKPIHYLKLHSNASAFNYLLLILIAVISLPALSYIIAWNEAIKLPQFMSSIEVWMREKEDFALKVSSLILSGDTIGILFINLLVIGIIPAVCEEFLFRGIIITWFKNQFRNIHIAVFLSAFIFSAIHFQFYGLVPRFLLGLYFGYLFIWTGSLLPCIIAHFINNGTAVIVSYLYNKQLINIEYDNFGDVGDNYLLIGLSVLLTTVCIYFLYRKRENLQ